MISAETIKEQRAKFPALRGRDTIFFDNPGGTQVPEAVIDAVSDYWRNSCANVGGAFATSQRTDETVLRARQAMADLLGAPDPQTIVFGASMTALTFHIARSFAHICRPGDEIIVTDLDHDANVAPWRDLEANGVILRRVPFHVEDGTLDTAAFVAALRPGKTRLVALNYASNALGTITNIAPLIRLAKEAGALSFIDGVQSVPHLPTDVAALGCDFLACSAYKFFGPHIGVLYGRREYLETLAPHKVRPAKDIIPYRWEQGTLNHECLAGVAAAVKYLAEMGEGATRREQIQSAMRAVQAYENTLSAYLLESLARVPQVKVYGIADPKRVAERVPTIAFTRLGETPRAICERLAARNICCWSGDYYAVGVMERLGLAASGGAVRVGLAHYNTTEEIDRFLHTLTAAA